MRLINLSPSKSQQPFPLVLMALGDSTDGKACYHYRTTYDHGNALSTDGLEIVLASEHIAGGEKPDGLTVDSLLAICEDQARHQVHSHARMTLVAMQLQAARRALATDEAIETDSLETRRTGSKESTIVDATAAVKD